jgi:hypothetical protein
LSLVRRQGVVDDVDLIKLNCLSCLQLKLPEHPSWLRLLLGPDMESRQVKRVCSAVQWLYRQDPLAWLEPLHPNCIVSRPNLEKFEGKQPPEPDANPSPVVSVADNTPTPTPQHKREEVRPALPCLP